ncbi:hypothetical protein [Syntrophothermus lipocalidus]|uniref:Uncharacterized protein n=1 Tax=Syntrophothermus lipocalidus (strain DSM 12680 / TGB-C1) TaxID=643648 RepID=D7CPF4_SYNLT|nr:hypothetical protein [Syntrophothermus lipocalidus]ADI02589.1 hypothetical protein Slip_1834 [Syntrophothermus lipocalidus DSM 12680]
MLTRDEYIHLRNILEDRINEQYDLFLELTDGPNTGCVESAVETLLASISKNVNILMKLADVIESDSMYDNRWLEHLYNRKHEWLNTKTVRDRASAV